MHISIPERCLLFGALSLLLLCGAHCAKTLSAGDPCGGSEECGVGLACVPESPGSSNSICQATDECRTFGCNVERGECICAASDDCLSGEFNFTSLDECQQSLSQAFDPSLCDQVRCPRVWCGPNLQYTPEGGCCPICPPEPSISPPITINPGCIENGTHYAEGETWRRDPCVTCTCEAGLPLCASMQCYGPPCANPVWLPDQCCPVCLTQQTFVPSATFISPSTDCEYDGEVYEDGDRWVPPNDPCKTCLCERGETLCMTVQCIFPDCENPIYSPDSCCPICPESGDEVQADVTSQPVVSPTPLPHSPTSSSATYSPDPTPPPEVPTQIPVTEPPTTQKPTTCSDSNGAVQQNGDSWCPTPYLMATCNSGVITYTEHRCSTPSCTNPTWIAGSCDCPVCPDKEEFNSVQVMAILEVSYDNYLRDEEEIRKDLDTALSAAGLKISGVKSSEYSSSQTHLVISIESPSGDMTPEEDMLETLLTQIDTLLISSVGVGHLEDVPSSYKTDTTDTDIVKQPPQRKSQGSSKTTAIVAVTASIAVAVVSAIVIALLIIHVWRRHQRPKTVIV